MSFLEESLRSTAEELFSATDDHQVTVAELDELGWSELFDEEPKAAVGILAEMQGRGLGVSRLLELSMATELDGLLDPRSEALAIPMRSLSLSSLAELDDALLLVGAPETVVVPVASDEGISLVRGIATTTQVAGIDPNAGVRRLATLEVGETIVLPAGTWDRAIAIGSLELAEETLGVVGAEIDLAVDHVTNRHQFGVPLGTFQAVQHRLADAHVARAAARAVADLAWESRDPAFCAAALGAARRAFVTARIHGHQVMGAMGFTWEHRQHWYLRRGLLLDLLLDHRPGLAAAVDTIITSSVRSEIWT